MKLELIELTKKLIRFRSTENYPQEKDECFEFIQSFFESHPAVIKRIKNKYCNAIVISNSNSKKVDLMLNGHIDVVEGDDTQFRPLVERDRIYGRGAIDMKGAIAVMMYFMRNILSKKPIKTVGLTIVSDEEVQYTNSTQYLLKDFGYRPKFTIVGEETGFDIAVKQKGSLNLVFNYSGEVAHSAFPKEGVNSVIKLIEVFNELNGLEMFKQDKGFAASINLSALEGGGAINSVPDLASMKVNIRFVNEKELEIILNKLKNLKVKDKRLKVLIYEQGGVMRSHECKKQISALCRTVFEIIGSKPEQIKTSTSSDARYFSEQKLPVVVFGPKGKNYHKENEYVEISSLEDYQEILRNLLLTL